MEFLAKVDIFKNIGEDSLADLAGQVRLCSLPEGHIIKDNDPSNGLYIIKSGKARVTKSAERPGAEAVLAVLQEGDSFGEIGLIDGMRRSANVTAIEPVECYFLPREAFLNALEENPEIAIGMLSGLAGMVRSADRWIAELL